jgi:transcriptional regulator with XRE-family HTH domain
VLADLERAIASAIPISIENLGNSMARKAAEEGPYPLDIALGSRVGLRRNEPGLAQAELASACGITFQQVQKYEHGANRFSFSRLVGISLALKCSVADLIGGLDKSKSSGALAKQIGLLAEVGASDLLESYVSIASPKRRGTILSLARQPANQRDEPFAERPRNKPRPGSSARKSTRTARR